ncbi:hypothetical protein [Dactylosporangium sp. NPDC005555]|uniref:hypothetical protein n=1 Tax=Dactylosporangium sp. NPDC005555 TaxID=3154889 RepID=UPI0033AD93A9
MTDNLRLDPAPAIVRQAFWLAAIGFLLVLAKTAATGTLVAGFGRTYAAGAGEAWTPGFDLIADEIRWRLVTALGVGVVLTLMVGVAAMAVGRRGDSSRTLVGFVGLVAAAVLVLGVTFSPESAIAADDAASLAYYETLVPAWFQTLSAVTVLGVVVLFGIAFLRMGRAAAADYYQDYDPAARWRGFGSWLDFLRRR